MAACTRMWMDIFHLGSSQVATRTSRVVISPICLALASLRSHHRKDAMLTDAQNAHRAFSSSKPRERERVLFSSHQKIEGPVDQWLLSQVDLIVTAMPAMRGPADQSVLRQLLNAAENLDSTRSKYIEYPEPSELDKAYTNDHQPKLLKAVKAASMEALAMEKRVAVLRGAFTSLQSKLRELEREVKKEVPKP